MGRHNTSDRRQHIDAAKSVAGKYSTWSLRETPEDLCEKHFRADGRDFQLHSAVRSAVAFEERNLVDDDLASWRRGAFDIVFCRNVTMYFTPEAVRAVIARITESLTPGGFLFLGHAETLRSISQDFHLRHTHETFYYQRREDCEAHRELVPAGASTGDVSTETTIAAVAGSNDSWFSIIQRASERVQDLTEQRGRAGDNGSGIVGSGIPHPVSMGRSG
jgi:chemotaxis protein methyltransferase CheR